ncbi:MAG: 50S ribosomal protein L29 [Saprospiraceae bacterium]|nr:50S ribosomal protein L29 [Bacteroidia bacterium]NNE16046.1 50S ribosomal protein L29 [Saprospiraceae bacterium]NNL91269.1 50S ribosomal protein L29 [Saprospiraceae bacterium]
MATKKFIELQDYTDEQLVSELEQTETNLGKLRFDHTLKGLENPLRLREARKDVARLKTEIRRREISNMTSEQLAERTKKIARRRNNR